MSRTYIYIYYLRPWLCHIYIRPWLCILFFLNSVYLFIWLKFKRLCMWLKQPGLSYIHPHICLQGLKYFKNSWNFIDSLYTCRVANVHTKYVTCDYHIHVLLTQIWNNLPGFNILPCDEMFTMRRLIVQHTYITT